MLAVDVSSVDLAPGTTTGWTVHETLRKAYQIDYLDGAE